MFLNSFTMTRNAIHNIGTGQSGDWIFRPPGKQIQEHHRALRLGTSAVCVNIVWTPLILLTGALFQFRLSCERLCKESIYIIRESHAMNLDPGYLLPQPVVSEMSNNDQHS